jgi:EsV-1-7 cysteine-rich motif
MDSHEDPAEMPAEVAHAAAHAAQGEQRSDEFVARAEPETFWTADAVKRLVALHAGNTPQMLQQLAQGLQHAPDLSAAFGTAAELQCAHSDCQQPALFGHLEGVGTPSSGPRYCSAHKLAGMSNIAESSMPSMTSARSPLLPSAASFAENLEGHAGTHWMNIGGAAGGRSSSSRASLAGIEGSATYMGALLTPPACSLHASAAAARDPSAAQCLAAAASSAL